MLKDIKLAVSLIDSARNNMIAVQTYLAENNLPQDEEIGKKIYDLTNLLNQALEIMKKFF